MSCPCDRCTGAAQLTIVAGLETIPRQIAAFAEFRARMLAALGAKAPLAAWRARGADDLGVMLLEMWAYVCDCLAFYDEVIAHEVYLRTAQQRASLRKLVGLLGYVPRPAVAASVDLALSAEGRQAVTLPKGTAFRSGAFDSESPQVFELDAAAKIHPFLNRFSLQSPRPSTVATSTTTLLLEVGSGSLKAGDIVLVEVQGQAGATQVATVSSAAIVEGKDTERYLKVSFAASLQFPSGTSPAQISLSRPTQTAYLWVSPTTGTTGTLAASVPLLLYSSSPTLTVDLDAVYRQIKSGDTVILAVGTDYHWFEVTGTSESMKQVTAGGPLQTLDKDGNEVTVVAPPVSTPVTRLTLSGQGKSWTIQDPSAVVVHYHFVDAGTVTVEAKTSITAADTLQVADSIETPTGYTAPSLFLLEDKNEVGCEVDGSLDWSTGVLTLDQGAQWATALVAPVQVYGNVVSASRGETVSAETLGSGDASVANQSFTLKKKPLTYRDSPTADNERGVASTLKIYVDSILWSEVSSFFDAAPDAQVYVVRQDDEGESVVTFGDGKNGARLPTGTDNVVAYYRYGAGATSPPAGSITQLAKPVKGLKSVRNPVAASGGADADSTKELRTYAPRSALLLGRAVSMQDMEAAAAGVSGVRAVRVEWRWHSGKQRPVVQVWYVGKANAAKVSQALRRLSDPSTPIDVQAAVGVPVRLSLDVEVDEKYLEATVLAAVRAKLTGKKTGLLSPERIGIGRPLYRSRIFEAVLSVAGAKSVRGMLWNGQSFEAFALSPGSGQYFDLEGGALLLNAKGASNG